ncbi:betaine-homocysteine S-methyltransferase-like isoform X3 [Tachypleus tridentatus]|uniref:betaine-homocysteine S-methyltransferase-like isoform X3 n=1 Tax=Tachypleus tridentatus TaxID=6853 RepID=UPI003FD2125A
MTIPKSLGAENKEIMASISSAIKHVKLLDGGLATELMNFGFQLDDDPLWSSSLLATNPQSIVGVHESYLRSGSDIITTASYQASVEGFEKYFNVSVEEAEKLIGSSVSLAIQACENFWNQYHFQMELAGKTKPLVAGSVGPYGAVLHDGSEYTGNYVDNMTLEQLMAWHRPRIRCLVEAGCDILAFETIPATKEGIALLKLLYEFPEAKAWLSFSCQDPHKLAHQESFETAVKSCLAVAPQHQLLAIGVNCCPPRYVQSLLSDIQLVKQNLPLLAYPNSGEFWEARKGWMPKLESHPLHYFVEDWIDLGVRYIGGCCRVTPYHIQKISEILQTLASET